VKSSIAHFQNALPFYISLTLLPVLAFGAFMGGWWLLIVPLYAWHIFSLLDVISGLNKESIDPDTKDADLFWFRLITIIWFPIQLVVVYGGIWVGTHTGLNPWEQVGLMVGVGIMSGGVGIVYAHELMHQKSKFERHLGDGLMAMTLYGHFRSEHLLVHHRYVGTPKDPVTARYNEGFYRFFSRILVQCFISSWRAEAAMLARKNLPVWHYSNPFWKYATLELIFLGAAFWIGGWVGIGLFLFQAIFSILELELVNYVEHYGLTREHLGDGKYEHTKPRHSWNADHRFSNYLLVNLQRHSDHHYKPDRRYPLLQTYSSDEAPHLPFGYAWMTLIATSPPLWKRMMNPRVRAWRAQHYPDITDWEPYNKALNPRPR
jgi:alkane 1-monooxygenase